MHHLRPCVIGITPRYRHFPRLQRHVHIIRRACKFLPAAFGYYSTPEISTVLEQGDGEQTSRLHSEFNPDLYGTQPPPFHRLTV